MKLENKTYEHSQYWVGALIGGLASLGTAAINAASQKDAPTDKYQTSGAVNSNVNGNFIDYLLGDKSGERDWNYTLPDGSSAQVTPGINTGYDSLDAQYLANQEDYALQNYYNNIQSDRNLANQLKLIQNSSAAEKLGYQNAGISTANLTQGSIASQLSGSTGVGSGVSAPAADTGAIANANNAQQNANNLRSVGVQALTSMANAILTEKGLNQDAPVKESEADKNYSESAKAKSEKSKTDTENRILGKTEQSIVDKAASEADLTNQQYLTEQQRTALVGLQQITEKTINTLNDNQRKLLGKQVDSYDERFRTEMDEVRSRIKLNDASSVRQYADAALAKVQEAGQSLQNQLTAAQIPNAAQLSKAIVDEAKARIKLAVENAKQEQIKRKHDAWQSGQDPETGNITNMPRYIVHSILEEINGALSAAVGGYIGTKTAGAKRSYTIRGSDYQ